MRRLFSATATGILEALVARRGTPVEPQAVCWKRAPLICAAFALLSSSFQAFGADALNESRAVSLIRNADVINQGFPLRAAINGKEVIVQTRRSTKASDKDCKIDAIFVAKTLIDAYPTDIQQMKVLFDREGDLKYTEVTVTPDEIKDYASGKVTQQQLLGSVKLAIVDPVELDAKDKAEDQFSHLEPGPFKERRLVILDQIQNLRNHGTGVKPFEQMFQTVEVMIRDGKTAEADKSLSELSERLKEQEKMRIEAVSRRAHTVQNISGPPGTSMATKTGNHGFGNGSANSSPPGLRLGNASNSAENHLAGQNLSVGQFQADPGHARCDQIKQAIQSRPEETRMAYWNKLSQVPVLVSQRNLEGAENVFRELEGELQCGSQFRNRLPLDLMK